MNLDHWGCVHTANSYLLTGELPKDQRSAYPKVSFNTFNHAKNKGVGYSGSGKLMNLSASLISYANTVIGSYIHPAVIHFKEAGNMVTDSLFVGHIEIRICNSPLS